MPVPVEPNVAAKLALLDAFRTAKISKSEFGRRIAKDEKDPVKAARLLQHWVFKNIKASYTDNADNALAVLDNKAGDCTEYSLPGPFGWLAELLTGRIVDRNVRASLLAARRTLEHERAASARR